MCNKMGKKYLLSKNQESLQILVTPVSPLNSCLWPSNRKIEFPSLLLGQGRSFVGGVCKVAASWQHSDICWAVLVAYSQYC